MRVTPGVSPDTHPAISTGGPNTKFGFDLDDARGGDRARCRRRRALDLEGLHFHIGSQILELDAVPRGARGARARSATSRTYNLGGGLGVAYTASEQPAVDRGVRRARRCAPSHEVFGPASASLDEPGRALVANSTRDALHGRVGQAQRRRPTSPSTAACRTTCARCSTARATRRRSPIAPRRRRRAATSPASTASPATCIVARRAAAPTRGRATCSSTPATGAYGSRDGQQLQRRPAPAGRLRRRTATRALVVRRETYEDLLRARRRWLSRFRIGLLGHGTVGGGVRRRCSPSAPTRSSASPGCGPRSPAS